MQKRKNQKLYIKRIKSPKFLWKVFGLRQEIDRNFSGTYYFY